ncbi:MAG: hypothetical protein AAFV07_15890, partial [Bacteroidota bacterium]
MAEATENKPKVIVPEWAHEIKRKYLSQNVSQFILHGNINDYVPVERDGQNRYYRIREFLNQEMFKYKDIVIYFDRAAGIRFRDDRTFGGDSASRKEFVATLKLFDELTDNNFSDLNRNPARSFFVLDTYFNLMINRDFIDSWFKEVDEHLGKEESDADYEFEEEDLIDRFMRRTLGEFDQDAKKRKASLKSLKNRLDKLKEKLAEPKSIAFVIDYAETLIPAGDPSSTRAEENMLLVFMQKWAKEKKFLEADLTIAVLTESITTINQQYVRNPYTHDISISYPEETDRLKFIQWFFTQHEGSQELFEMSDEVLAKNTAGLGLVQLDIIMSEAARNKLP